MLKLDWKIRLGTGITFILLAIGMFIYGFILKEGGGDYNQYWVLSLLLIWGGSDQIRKALSKISKRTGKENSKPATVGEVDTPAGK